MAPKKYTTARPLPDGCILTDSEKKNWRIGKIIGKGGFGLIYLGNLMTLYSVLNVKRLHRFSFIYRHGGTRVQRPEHLYC